MGVTDAIPSTRLCPESKPWYPAAICGVGSNTCGTTRKEGTSAATQSHLRPTARPWTPAPSNGTTPDPVVATTPALKRNTWAFIPQFSLWLILLSVGLATLGKLCTTATSGLHRLPTTSGGTPCSLALRALRERATPAKVQHNPDRFRAMARKILRKNKSKCKQVDKLRRLRRYFEKRNSAYNLAASNRSLKPEQRHHWPATGTSTCSGPKPVTSATTHFATAHLTTRNATKKRQSKPKGGALRPSPTATANSPTSRYFTPRIRITRLTRH